MNDKDKEKRTRHTKLAPWQVEDAARLKALYETWKKSEAGAGWSQEKLGAEYKIGAQAVVWQILNGRIPLNERTVLSWCRALGVRPEEISPTLAARIGQQHAQIRQLVSDSYANVKEGPAIRGKVPVISWVRAGNWMEAIDNFEPGMAEDWVDVTVPVRRGTFALVVQGDSMEPVFTEGGVIIVDAVADGADPLPGKYVVAKRRSDNAATLKQLTMDGGIAYLKPVNPRYPILTLDEDTDIIGVVRQFTKTFD
ncbi:LexA family transcriptional regulator [Crenobacter caeni]|uniref:Peptidase S24/S26A/S26B/S26C domain-containing protein n=1 Tax=Crenobacter caeni TaxID=2705474 RepID=A0A6B2KNJ2_9NEIS|nr:XRE family transcriptional regulator [Crenobacter caeni]NDV11651.1 hypothetical protein [Crenobacter caeni]